MTQVGLHWQELLMPLLQKYKLNITWGDQDLLNIIFYYNPGKEQKHTQTQHLSQYACYKRFMSLLVYIFKFQLTQLEVSV